MDYSQMSDAELNRRIAELQGWRFHRESFMAEWHTKLTSPDGVLIYDHASKTPILEVERINDYLPQYASDMNAAAELLREMEGSLVWTHYDKVWECSAEINPQMESWAVVAHANPARAIAICWLQWRDGQNLPDQEA